MPELQPRTPVGVGAGALESRRRFSRWIVRRETGAAEKAKTREKKKPPTTLWKEKNTAITNYSSNHNDVK